MPTMFPFPIQLPFASVRVLRCRDARSASSFGATPRTTCKTIPPPIESKPQNSSPARSGSQTAPSSPMRRWRWCWRRLVRSPPRTPPTVRRPFLRMSPRHALHPPRPPPPPPPPPLPPSAQCMPPRNHGAAQACRLFSTACSSNAPPHQLMLAPPLRTAAASVAGARASTIGGASTVTRAPISVFPCSRSPPARTCRTRTSTGGRAINSAASRCAATARNGTAARSALWWPAPPPSPLR
jgi:hypothetical protein